jgi:hypothetical protein
VGQGEHHHGAGDEDHHPSDEGGDDQFPRAHPGTTVAGPSPNPAGRGVTGAAGL